MRRLAGAAIVGTRAYQHHVVDIGLALLALAALLGITVAAAVTRGLVRPVRRLLAGTAAVEQGALDTVVPITSRDEIGRLTQSFNSMVGELRMKAQIRETFGKYVDPRIVAGLIDRPELTDAKGSRREMTILFCDMRGFTTFSEGMTPAAVVTVLNRYMTLMSEPIRRNSGILDKYIGDGIMAFWGPPFTGADEQARLACLAALDQIAGLAAFRAELSDLTGLKRGLPEIDIRIGVATGDVVAGNIGSEQTRNYTVIGDAVNLGSRLCRGAGRLSVPGVGGGASRFRGLPRHRPLRPAEQIVPQTDCAVLRRRAKRRLGRCLGAGREVGGRRPIECMTSASPRLRYRISCSGGGSATLGSDN